MASKTASPCFDQASIPLRRRSIDDLRSELARYLAGAGAEIERDWRDVLVGLAAFHDCATRLGADPVALFDAASAGTPTATRELATAFARRTDITLPAFGWVLVESRNGPCYQAAG